MKWACMGVVLLVGCGPQAVPSGASGPPADWTHKELLDHLKAKGVEFTVIESGGGTSLVAPYVGLHFDDGLLWDEVNVWISLEATEQSAREKAGAHGDRGLAWGRFSFRASKKEYLDRARKALGASDKS